MPIFDQGYQHWNGQLSGHGWRWLAVTRHGVRALLQNRFIRLLLLFAWLPAIVLVTVLTLWGLLEQQAESVMAFLARLLPADVIAKPREYRTAVWTISYAYYFKAELLSALFLVLIVGPNLISRDLRFNALPLYFSRPLRRFDYFAGKLGVIGFFLAATLVLPAVGAYLMGLAFSLDLGVIRDTHRMLWAGILYGLIITLSAGTLMLALSSLSRRSIYVGLAWAGLVFLSFMISQALIEIGRESSRRYSVKNNLEEWVGRNPPPAGMEIYNGYPSLNGSRRWMYPQPGDPPLAAEEQAKSAWYSKWSIQHEKLYRQANEELLDADRTDWRPILSYATNLDRMGDWLLDTDSAWVLLAKAVERPRAALGPMARGRGVPLPSGPANERVLADRWVWQFPWYWSAGTLVGLWLLSVFVLSQRVKTLDRLK